MLAYKEVVYRDIWKGVDLKLFSNGQNLEEEFIVHPGADASNVALAYEGIKGLSVADDGSLQVATAFGDIAETSPRIYQEITGKPVPLSGNFKVGAQNSYTFEVAKHDQQSYLIIDPTVIYSKPRDGKKADQGALLYSSFLGGSVGDQGTAIAVDNAGNAYITGWTYSGDFPTTPGAFQTTAPNGSAFVTKVNALGSAPLVYSTYLGQLAGGYGIAVDSAGSAYAAGRTANDTYDFPTTANAFQRYCNSSAFVTKLTPSGDGLIYSTCLGNGSTANAVAVDSTGNMYITGHGYGGSFPTTPNAFQTDAPYQTGGAVISVLNPSASGASSLIYSSFLGGNPSNLIFLDWGNGIAVDAYGKVYVTGFTSSLDFPVTSGAFMTVYPASDCVDGCRFDNGYLPSGFVAKFDPLAFGVSSLLYATFLGGSAGTEGNGVAVDSLGNAYVTGTTGDYYGYPRYNVPFPTTPGAYQTVADNNDAFVTKLNAAGNNLIYSTLLGGNGQQWSAACALDSSNDAYVTGYTDASNFPIAGNAFLPNDPNPAFHQGFVTKFNTTGTGLLYSSYLGGTTSSTNGPWPGGGIAVDQVGDAYVTGSTWASNFPITSFAFQPAFAGGQDAFVTKFPIGAAEGLSITGITPTAGGNAGQVTPEIVGTGYHSGASAQLNCGGNPVKGQNVSVSAGGRILNATFDLTATAPGTCDVMVTNPDQTSAKLTRGFTVVKGGAPQLWLQLYAPPAINSFGCFHSLLWKYWNCECPRRCSHADRSPSNLTLKVNCQLPTPSDLGISWIFPSGATSLWSPKIRKGILSSTCGFWICQAEPSDFSSTVTLIPKDFEIHVKVHAMHAELGSAPDSEFSRTGDLNVVKTSFVAQTLADALLTALGGKRAAELSPSWTKDQILGSMTDGLIRYDKVEGSKVSPFSRMLGWLLGIIESASGIDLTGGTLEDALRLLARGAFWVNLHNKQIEDAYTEYKTSATPNDLVGPTGLVP